MSVKCYDCVKMCKVQTLRALVNQRLSAAVEEIFVVFERTIAEYEEELSRAKEENERQRQLLDAGFKKPEVVLHRADAGEDHPPPEQAEWNSEMEQEEPQPFHITALVEEPEPPHIKEEEEDHSISQEGEHLEVLEEFPVIGVTVKSEDDEGESEEEREVEPPSSSSTQHMTTEADGDHCGGSQAHNLLAPLSDSDDTTSHSPDTDDEDSEADMTCHTDNTRWKCDNIFDNQGNLKKHMQNHAGEKPFACSVCSKRFSQIENLNRHTTIHTIHTGVKPFACSICGKGFSQQSNLKEHARKHTGKKHFPCLVCGKKFIYKSKLKTHTRIHTGEKPFSCTVCGKCFSQKANLHTHTRVHTGEKPFPCTMCGKRFSQKDVLIRHTRIHTGEKPFCCTVCGKSFSRKITLMVHKRTHARERNVECVSSVSQIKQT
ncbi:zinc finger and SCAN domain-containing protein 2-like isoform X1 [Dunckerocampus dactyliophorus]|uniref:zinc finger and SCAN domain-containing protein 2-like isoform X1 n=1 Tax=Dunckerocampus dactyliophorus TaxID=161453 RepID=UPI00240678F1|nr:zinc finger and SCAN domain-containing protein 2-like isoform X1 [Dunckerocampus dactyliophorus]